MADNVGMPGQLPYLETGEALLAFREDRLGRELTLDERTELRNMFYMGCRWYAARLEEGLDPRDEIAGLDQGASICR